MKFFLVAFFLSLLLFILLSVFLLYKLFRHITKPKSAEYIANEKQDMQAYITEEKPKLLPWSEHACDDIGVRMTYKKKKTSSWYLTGQLLSPSNQPIVAFYRIERGWRADGYMYASTSDFDLYYELKDTAFDIMWNGELFGKIDEQGNIYDATNARIGFAKHPMKVSVNVPFFSGRLGDSSFPLTLNGRLLAHIIVAPNLADSNQQTIALSNENLGNKVIDLVDKNHTKEEEQWLIALAILEVAFHGYWLM